MEQFGIIDIGSNTVVMVIYKMENEVPKVVEHQSEPVHLIQYHQDGIMQQEGIDYACKTIQKYHAYMKEHQVTILGGFITEPWRNLKNEASFLEQLQSNGIPITPLTGEQEAQLDFYGSQIDCADITDGLAFDIGGGSTEFILFEDHSIQHAVSIPIGCVRLSKLPVEEKTAQYFLQNLQQDYPAFQMTKDSIIGIGGTARALGLLSKEMYQTEEVVSTKQAQALLQQLLAQEKKTVQAMKKVISKGRQPVFIPGLNMLVEILKTFQVKIMRISQGCVREGFLFQQLK